MSEEAVISIIVPVLNEAEIIENLLDHLKVWQGRPSIEILVVDGGSSDGTFDSVSRAGFVTITADRGRAAQMNAGAAKASGDILLFLHADTRLPEDAIRAIRRSSTREKFWGRFNIRISGASLMFSVIAAFMNWRSRLTGIATGDQAIFVERTTFDTVGGFANQPLMEDIELSRRLKTLAHPTCLIQRVTTSGRRWEKNGIWKTIILMWRLRFSYARGMAATEIARRYG